MRREGCRGQDFYECGRGWGWCLIVKHERHVHTPVRGCTLLRLVVLVAGRYRLVRWLGSRLDFVARLNGALNRALAARGDECDSNENGVEIKPLHAHPYDTACMRGRSLLCQRQNSHQIYFRQAELLPPLSDPSGPHRRRLDSHKSFLIRWLAHSRVLTSRLGGSWHGEI